MSTAGASEHVTGEIRAHMARKRLTGTDLAAHLHVSQQAASDRLTGKVRITLDEVAAIADWLNVDVAELFPRRKGTAA